MQACQNESKILILEIEVEELVCGDGQRIFEGRVLDLSGIKSVTANIQTRKAQIRYRDHQVSAKQIEEHLKEFGFTIDGVEGNQVTRGRLPSCCFQKNVETIEET